MRNDKLAMLKKLKAQGSLDLLSLDDLRFYLLLLAVSSEPQKVARLDKRILKRALGAELSEEKLRESASILATHHLAEIWFEEGKEGKTLFFRLLTPEEKR
ncbi:MAG: hypothetical protein HY731_11375 [Candidatus Tectomicrobia bacterium]|nr:hypothetical protein [Candidatus Tectomicrobia bacterium]